MNQLYSSSGLDSGQVAQLMQMVRMTDPQQAREQVERMLRERGITQEEWRQTAERASAICRALGIR